MTGAVSPDELSAYCREIEAHLCRRNGGHLIRVVGPAFDLVKGWADAGVPLTVVKDGIDRTTARAARKPSARERPVPLDFCAADVRDAFDRWRRAVGVAASLPVAAGSSSRGTLAAHVERVSRELTAYLLGDRAGPALRPAIEAVLVALTEMGSSASTARGTARDALIARLAALEASLIDAAEVDLPAARARTLQQEAERDLAPFRTRLDSAAWASTVRAATRRAVRLALGLPAVAYE